MTVVIGTTMAAFVTDQQDTSLAWLYNAEAIRDSTDDLVLFFAALELDARGLTPFAPVLARMNEVAGQPRDAAYWTFGFDDHADEITTANRLRRIVIGQNIVTEYAMTVGASHLLFCAADCAPPPDVLPKLLEMDHPLVAPECSTYCLSGPTPMVPDVPHASLLPLDRPTKPRYPFPVQEHMASAACILLSREVFRQLRWRVDVDKGMTDDPALHHDALHLLGIPTYVRKDMQARHYPESIPRIEDRGHDMTVRR